MPDFIDRIRAAKSIRLECPPTVPAMSWEAESVILGRVDALQRQTQLPRLKLPDTVSVPPTADETITLNFRYGFGHQPWDIYEADCEGGVVIAKIFDLSFFSEWTLMSTACANQFHVFNLCERLQGYMLPRLAGMFGNATGTLWCTLYEDGGRELIYAEKADRAMKREAFAITAAAAALGVAVDLRSYKWLRRSGSYKLVEFADAEAVDTVTADDLAMLERRLDCKVPVEELMEMSFTNAASNNWQFWDVGGLYLPTNYRE